MAVHTTRTGCRLAIAVLLTVAAGIVTAGPVAAVLSLTVQTDQPLYTPGDTVVASGVLSDGGHGVPAATVSLFAFGSTNRGLFKGDAATDPNGRFSARFPLPNQTAPDTYVLTAAYNNVISQTTFSVSAPPPTTTTETTTTSAASQTSESDSTSTAATASTSQTSSTAASASLSSSTARTAENGTSQPAWDYPAATWPSIQLPRVNAGHVALLLVLIAPFLMFAVRPRFSRSRRRTAPAAGLPTSTVVGRFMRRAGDRARKVVVVDAKAKKDENEKPAYEA